MPVVTFVHSTPDAHGEQFFIDNADVGPHHGHFTCSLTEAQFRDNFKSRGVSEQEIEDLVASFLIVAGAILTALVILIALVAVTGASGAGACN